MSYLVLARKYRPTHFDEIIGQTHVSRTLKNEIEMDRVAHAYLFAGPRGIGKTSTARVFAKSLNCAGAKDKEKATEILQGENMDVIEIDGASNRGIDQVRELRENAKFGAVNSPYKIYIIDEVHMLTQEAFNALLKILEEPPSHIKFFFATTEPHKVPATILSRCQRFDLHKLSVQDMVEHLKRIAKKEKITVDDKALLEISKNTDGSLRDAEGLLDQLVSFSKGTIKHEDIAAMMGWVSRPVVLSFYDHLLEDELGSILELIHKLDQEGKDLALLIVEWINHLRDLLVIQVCDHPEKLLDLDDETMKVVKTQAGHLTRSQILQMLELSFRTENRIRFSVSKKAAVEALAIRLHLILHSISIEGLLEKLEQGKDFSDSSKAEESPKKKENPKAPIERTSAPVIGIPENVNEDWQNLVKDLSEEKPLLGVYLNEGRFNYKDKKNIELIYPYEKSFHVEALKEDQKYLEQKVQKVFNGAKLHFVLDEAPQIEGQKDKIKSSLVDDPLVKKALDVFKGHITELK